MKQTKQIIVVGAENDRHITEMEIETSTELWITTAYRAVAKRFGMHESDARRLYAFREND